MFEYRNIRSPKWGESMLHVDTNERPRGATPEVSLVDTQRACMAFVIQEAGFAQVYTVNRAGFPVGRTMVAVLNDDWTVDLVQRRVHRRLGHIAERPQIEVAWIGSASPTSVNDRPHVYDFGLPIPRAVFLRGLARTMDDEWTLERYRRRSTIQRAKGLTRAPERTDENVRMTLVGVRVDPVQVRAEGFGVGAQSFTWTAERTEEK